MSKRKESIKSLQRKLDRVKKARARDIERRKRERGKLKDRAKKLRHELNRLKLKNKELVAKTKKAKTVSMKDVKESLRIAAEGGFLPDMVDNWSDVFEVDEGEIYDLYEEDAA